VPPTAKLLLQAPTHKQIEWSNEA